MDVIGKAKDSRKVACNGLVSASKILTIGTNIPTGYSLSISAEHNPALPPATGTILDPTTLINNTWRFAFAGSNVVGVLNDFDASDAAPTPGSVSRWANSTASTTLKSTKTAAANDATAIYYGAKGDMSLPGGTYENTVHLPQRRTSPIYQPPASFLCLQIPDRQLGGPKLLSLAQVLP